ncbi:MAG: penicillin-binding protein 2 [Actinobacteria bacterium]|nr:penicillin-binding protein 2 [Actinomycetota bacterium]
MTADSPRHRLGILAVCALSLFGALFARLWFLQVVEAEALDQQVNENSTRVVVIPAPRGRILDRNSVALVENRESIVAAIDVQAFRDRSDDEQAEELDAIAAALSRQREPVEAITVDFIEKRMNDQRFSQFRPVPLVEDISVDEEIYLREQADRYPSLVVERQTVRSYPYGSLAAHVLGYVGAITEDEWDERKVSIPGKPYEKSDEIGKSGVERTYEQYLRGKPGKRVYEISRTGRIVRELVDQRVEPEPGDDVYLSIDARIQYKTEEALQAQILKSGSPTPYGAATVLDPRNGQVVAMASYPTYDPSTLVGGISQDEYDRLTAAPEKIMSNRNIQEAYPAASTFKLASSYAGYKLGIITPDQYIDDPGFWRLCKGNGSGCLKRNSGDTPHGSVNLSLALTVSSDVYSYRIGDYSWAWREERGWGDDALQQKIEELGYGSRTGIDLTAESPGLIPTPESNKEIADTLWERDPANYNNDPEQYRDAQLWRGGNSADLAIGQGSVGVTPLQSANAYAALANPESIQYEPSVLKVVTAANQPDDIHKAYVADELRRVDFGTAKQAFLDGFHGVVNSPDPPGTAYSVFQTFPLSTFPLSGKTGTAEVGDEAAQRADNSLFVAYGPNPDNQYVVSVMIQGGGYGSEAAAPATYMILEPIADGSIESFQVPEGGLIDAEAAAERASGIQTSSTD